MIKKISILNIVLFASCLIFSACGKQNIPKAELVEKIVPKVGSEAYYENLRAYKRSNHQIYYGWFGGMENPGGTEAVTVMDHIPDSVDIVSMWGGGPPLNSINHLKMKEIQRVKGTRFVAVELAMDNFLKKYGGEKFFEEYVGKGKEKMIAGFSLVANNILKEVNTYGLDGFDLDYEPHGGILQDPEIGADLVIELGKVLGPQSKSGKLLIVDSFIEELPNRVVPYIDYYIVQAYSPQGGSVGTLLDRFGQVAGMPYEKCIAAENFEALWETGGLLASYAAWNPPGTRKGGVAAYHPEYEYTLNPDYKWTRQAIQIMNPAVR